MLVDGFTGRPPHNAAAGRMAALYAAVKILVCVIVVILILVVVMVLLVAMNDDGNGD